MAEIIELATTESTNNVALRYAADGAEHGFAVIARQQTGGRGRLGKQWRSFPGLGLYCSIVVRPEIATVDYPKLTLIAGLATAESLDKLTGFKFGLKWPNDIFFAGKKCGGILVESSSLVNTSSGNFAVIGIGINLNHRKKDFPQELQVTATSIQLITGDQHNSSQVFSTIHSHILNEVGQMEQGRFSDILARWRTRDILYGREMEWVGVHGKVIKGIASGPDGEGRLHVCDNNGKWHEVLSGDVQLVK